jgi:hypothetical protein
VTGLEIKKTILAMATVPPARTELRSTIQKDSSNKISNSRSKDRNRDDRQGSQSKDRSRSALAKPTVPRSKLQ